MSRQRSTKIRQKAAYQAHQAAVQFERNSTLFADQLTVPQLQQVLIRHGVPRAELNSLRKLALIERVQKLTGAQRVSSLLNHRAGEQAKEGKAQPNSFSRLNTQLVVLVASYLDLQSHAEFARASQFLRVRLTLSLNGTPSPGLSALKSVDRRDLKEHLAVKLLLRAANLEDATLQMCRCPTLPKSLRFLCLHNLEWSEQLLSSLGACKQLERIELSMRSADRHYTSVNVELPMLRSLSIINGTWGLNLSVHDLVVGSPALEYFHFEAGQCDLQMLMQDLSSMRSLRALSLLNIPSYHPVQLAIFPAHSLRFPSSKWMVGSGRCRLASLRFVVALRSSFRAWPVSHSFARLSWFADRIVTLPAHL